MNRYFASVLLVFCLSAFASAQTPRAITQDGKLVILDPNGTWRYADQTSQKQDASTGIPRQTPITLTRGGYVVLFDDTKWQVPKKQDERERQMFNHVKGDGYAMAITERIEVPQASWKKIALENAKKSRARRENNVGREETRQWT